MKRNPPAPRRSPPGGGGQTAVILDLDDTLIATSAGIKPALFRAVRDLGISPACARAVYARVHRRIFSPARYARALFRDPRAATAAARAIERSILAKPRAYNYPGVDGFLARLARRHALVLVSWGDPRWKDLKIKNAGIRRFFDAHITVSDVEKTAILRTLARRYRRLILVDDKAIACQSARALGIPAIRVRKSAKDAAYYRGLEARIEKKLKG